MLKKIDFALVTGFLVVGVLLVGSGQEAVAQEFLAAPPGGVIQGPPQMELPTVPPLSGSGTRGSGTRNFGMGSELPAIESVPADGYGQAFSDPMPASSSYGDLQQGLQPIEQGDEYNEYEVQLCDPALLESTGTWLQRGFWYTEADVMLMDRIWRRDNSVIAFQLNAGGNAFQGQDNALFLEGGRQGAEATPRLKLGRFLFRDHKNRNHSAEFVFYGGGQWTKSGRLDAVGGGTLSVSNNVSGSNPSFTGATSMEYDYDSRFNSFEMNYRVKSRMRKDRMELEPSGHWVRRAQPSITRSLIAGVRYFDLSEDFDWNAFGIDDDNNTATDAQTGNYRVRTDNDLIGTQLGFSWTYETARWSLGVQNKSGMYLNHTDVDSNFEVTGGVTSGNNSITRDNLSFITEGALIGKWHLRPNLSIRAGLEILYVSSIAHASEQMNFVPVATSHVVADGDSTFMGGLIGIESYW